MARLLCIIGGFGRTAAWCTPENLSMEFTHLVHSQSGNCLNQGARPMIHRYRAIPTIQIGVRTSILNEMVSCGIKLFIVI